MIHLKGREEDRTGQRETMVHNRVLVEASADPTVGLKAAAALHRSPKLSDSAVPPSLHVDQS